ncbi:MAG TPA: hypothetical protein VHB46_01675 [Burkholderiales bacterium]|nr:hypothetical protein [Burkholderiales bacterium]
MSDFSYDPVTALDEATATGQAAAIFADIRATMGIPLVTSIWRGLAGMGNGLAEVWSLARPIYASGLPEAALARVVASSGLPEPEPLVRGQLAQAGIGGRDLDDIRAILAAYNRSNGMNLVALAALITPPATGAAADDARPAVPDWPPLRPLLAREAIDAETWSKVRQVNALGATGIDAGVATLWRHLAHWPGFLVLAHAAFAPLQSQGAIDAANSRVVALALAEGARMARLRPAKFEISPQARDTVTSYVRSPTQVARMVSIGHALARWLG